MAERTADGRFVPGNTISRKGGRPSREVELACLASLREKCGANEWEAIILKAIELAKDGDRHAREWLSGYLVGRPIQRVSVTEESPLEFAREIAEEIRAMEAML